MQAYAMQRKFCKNNAKTLRKLKVQKKARRQIRAVRQINIEIQTFRHGSFGGDSLSIYPLATIRSTFL